MQSAEILSRRLGTPYEIAPALIEYDVGIYEDRSDEGGWERYREAWREWKNGNFAARMEGGESYNDIEARFVPFIASLVERYARQDGSIILVGHGGTYLWMLPRILPNVDLSFALNSGMANTSYVLAEHGIVAWFAGGGAKSTCEAGMCRSLTYPGQSPPIPVQRHCP